MATCEQCDAEFDVADARDEYNAEFGDDADYDEDFGGDVCASCAISQTDSNIELGRAIDMMNGEEEYDAEHVERWL